MKIYTRMGDGGETSLPGGRRLPKTEKVFEALGNIDETNAAIGLAASFLRREKGSFPLDDLYNIQSNLLSIGAYVAASDSRSSRAINKLDEQTDQLELRIDEWDKQLPKLKNFILPEGVEAAAAFHLCRTLVRRTERSLHQLEDRGERFIAVTRYINRLSDYFFQAARFANHQADHRENIWTV